MDKTEIKLEDYSESHKEELNTWQDIEKEKGNSGLEKFVIPSGTKLGDSIEFFTNSIELYSKIAFDDDLMVGFVCYTINDNTSAHIELVGVNPNVRNKGYAKIILEKVKQEIKEKFGINKVTLSVNKWNKEGLKSFSKFAKQTRENSTGLYIGFEL